MLLARVDSCVDEISLQHALASTGDGQDDNRKLTSLRAYEYSWHRPGESCTIRYVGKRPLFPSKSMTISVLFGLGVFTRN